MVARPMLHDLIACAPCRGIPPDVLFLPFLHSAKSVSVETTMFSNPFWHLHLLVYLSGASLEEPHLLLQSSYIYLCRLRHRSARFPSPQAGSGSCLAQDSSFGRRLLDIVSLHFCPTQFNSLCHLHVLLWVLQLLLTLRSLPIPFIAISTCLWSDSCCIPAAIPVHQLNSISSVLSVLHLLVQFSPHVHTPIFSPSPP